MKQELNLWPHRPRRVLAAAAFACGPAFAQSVLDIGTSVPDAASVKDGLLSEDACKELEASGLSAWA